MVDGREARVGRADYTLIGVELPAGARSVLLSFDSKPYHVGKTITLVAISIALVWCLVGALMERRARV
jgi:uncharacterized membrane protein YfhO